MQHIEELRQFIEACFAQKQPKLASPADRSPPSARFKLGDEILSPHGPECILSGLVWPVWALAVLPQTWCEISAHRHRGHCGSAAGAGRSRPRQAHAILMRIAKIKKTGDSRSNAANDPNTSKARFAIASPPFQRRQSDLDHRHTRQGSPTPNLWHTGQIG
jgi:hypothetical protein